MYREITNEQAETILEILRDECGCPTGDHGKTFVRAISDAPYVGFYPCTEWRFQGLLGFGGKFRNNGNHDNTPYVDCYQEDETPERLAMIERANARLTELFGGP